MMYGYFHRHTLPTEAHWQGSPVRGPVSEVVFKSVVLIAGLLYAVLRVKCQHYVLKNTFLSSTIYAGRVRS